MHQKAIKYKGVVIMNIEQELEDVIRVYGTNIELEKKTESIRDEIKQNHKLIIKYFFPYLLSTLKKWQPQLEEKAMYINLEEHYCFEVTIKTIDGYIVRAQEGEKRVYHRFQLDPVLEECKVANFILPKWSYDEIKNLFHLDYIKV